MKKTALIVITFISIILFSNFVSAQSNIDVNNDAYKFNFSLPSGWNEKKVEETSKNDAISYSFDRKDGKMGIMLLAFKVNEVKNLVDFVYTLEKDLTLNIPKIDGEYKDFDSGTYEGKTGHYKDSEFSEVIYYYRTKIIDGANYTYMLRFIMPSTFYNSSVESEIKKIADSFVITAQ